MIPDFVNPPGCLWPVLPKGVHLATLAEVRDRFVTNPKRAMLFSGLLRAIHNLKGAGCATLYLNGSYVTAKEIPGDYDACWDSTGVDTNKLDPVFFDFSNGRAAQKQKYYGEFFIFDLPADMAGTLFLDFFQTDKFSGEIKGIIKIDLSTM